jgi:hypothetical protein
MNVNDARSKILALIDHLSEETDYDGFEDDQGCLHPGRPDYDRAKQRVAKIFADLQGESVRHYVVYTLDCDHQSDVLGVIEAPAPLEAAQSLGCETLHDVTRHCWLLPLCLTDELNTMPECRVGIFLKEVPVFTGRGDDLSPAPPVGLKRSRRSMFGDFKVIKWEFPEAK